MKKIYFLYLSRQLHTPVIESQVINWIEVLQRKNIEFDLLIENPIADFFRKGNMKKTKETILNYEKRINGKIYYTFVMRKSYLFDFLSSLIKAISILTLIKSQKQKYKFDSIVIQTRYMEDDICLKIVKYFSKNVIVILDLRGDAPIEYLNRMGYDNEESIKENNIKKEYSRLRKNQLKMCLLADKIFCVSEFFKDKLIKDFKLISRNKFEVIAGGADSELFYFDSKIRTKIRAELGLERKLVLIYTGRLLHHWHKKELIFRFASILQKKHPNLFFICLSPDIDLANSLKETFNLDNKRVLIKMIPNLEINKYLNASDIGMILRDNIGTNRVSSPTKIPEYLLAGLPILMSNHIGDYSNYIMDNKSGQLISNNILELADDVILEDILTLDRNLISKQANKLFSKQKLSAKILSIYNKILQ